jgi:misacylated tRNA(Ala) deacylase
MTEQLYVLNSYIREFDATTVGINKEENALILDRTAFYPGGGGQPNDVGVIGIGNQKLPVIGVKKSGDDILHILEGTLPGKGQEVNGYIDWERRFALMRTHTALHILCGVVWRDYGARVTGGNMEPLRGRLDFEFETLQADLIHEIEEKINAEVDNARAVSVKILPRAKAFKIPDLIRTKVNLLPDSLKDIRTIEIEGLDLQADGGTHVVNTSEVGKITISKYKSKGKINKRIEISLD